MKFCLDEAEINFIGYKYDLLIKSVLYFSNFKNFLDVKHW